MIINCSKKNTKALTVNFELECNLTPGLCSRIIIEIIKYLLYQRGQIPCGFKELSQLANQPNVSGAHVFGSQCLRNKAVDATMKLNNIFEAIETEIYHQDESHVDRVAVVLGSTIRTPKDLYEFELPSLTPGALVDVDEQTAVRRNLVEVLRTLVSCEELHELISTKMVNTNVFMLVRKVLLSDVSDWFLPQDDYSLPEHGNHVVFRLSCRDYSLPPLISSWAGMESTPETDAASKNTEEEMDVNTDSKFRTKRCLTFDTPSPQSKKEKLSTGDDESCIAVAGGSFAVYKETKNTDSKWFQAPAIVKGFQWKH